MRVLFDIKHPAQAHFFRYVIAALRERGDKVLVTSRDKDETLSVLDGFGLEHVCLSRAASGRVGLARELLVRTASMAGVIRRFRPDVIAAKTAVTAGLAARLFNVPVVSVDDTEFATQQVALSVPFATVLCTGLGYERRLGRRQVRFNAPTALAHTHPRHFRPSADVLRARGVDPNEPFVVVRIKLWQAAHDWGVHGPSDEALSRLVDGLGDYGRVMISTERPLPGALASLTTPMGAGETLHLLAFARLYVGEGSSMAAEAACLGTPAVYLSPVSRRGYLDALEKRYGHVTTVADVDSALTAAAGFAEPEALSRARAARSRIASDCEDPVQFMLDVITRTANGSRPWLS